LHALEGVDENIDASKDLRSQDTEPQTKDPAVKSTKKRAQKLERKAKEMSIVLKEADSLESKSISSSMPLNSIS
jgi:hypothetical protein